MTFRILLVLIALTVRAVRPVSAEMILPDGIHVVTGLGDLYMSDVTTAVSMRSDAQNDTIAGVTFYGVSSTQTNDPYGTTISGPTIWGGSVPYVVNVNDVPPDPATYLTGVTNSNPAIQSQLRFMLYTLATASPLSVTTTLPNGTYMVQLLASDVYSTGAGQRVADITIEGQTTYGYDYWLAKDGSNQKASVLRQTVQVSDGTLNISLVPTTPTSQPHVSGMIINAVPEPSAEMLVACACGLLGSLACAGRQRARMRQLSRD